MTAVFNPMRLLPFAVPAYSGICPDEGNKATVLYTSMPRADRLLALLDLLRRHRGPVSGARLAEELGVSLRSLYRDVQSLRERGAEIDGEAGFGYVLKPGFLLPPISASRPKRPASSSPPPNRPPPRSTSPSCATRSGASAR
jgi:biotin operon repressor